MERRTKEEEHEKDEVEWRFVIATGLSALDWEKVEAVQNLEQEDLSAEDRDYWISVAPAVDVKLNIMARKALNEPDVFQGLKEGESMDALMKKCKELKRERENDLFQQDPRWA